MKLRRSLEPRKVFIGIYILIFGLYLFYGLQPADAKQYDIAAKLSIPSISLETGVTKLDVVDGQLPTPDGIAGSYTWAENKTLLIGHYAAVFNDLDEVSLGDEIRYDGKIYIVKKIEIREKSTIEMREVLQRADTDTLVIMTCAGQMLENGDATHRLLVTGVRV